MLEEIELIKFTSDYQREKLAVMSDKLTDEEISKVQQSIGSSTEYLKISDNLSEKQETRLILPIAKNIHLIHIGLYYLPKNLLLKLLSSLNNNVKGVSILIDLSKNRLLPNNGNILFDIIDALDRTQVTGIGLQNNSLVDYDIESLSNKLKHNKKIYYVHLQNNRIGTEGAMYLARILHTTEILELELFRNYIGRDGAQYFADHLKENNTKLKKLSLGDNILGDDGTIILMQALKYNKSLTHLYLSNNGISDTAMQEVANMLACNSSLTHLDLSNNNITNNGVEILTRTLQETKHNLNTLILNKNNISQENLAHIENLLKKNEKLEQEEDHKDTVLTHPKRKLETAIVVYNTIELYSDRKMKKNKDCKKCELL